MLVFECAMQLGILPLSSHCLRNSGAARRAMPCTAVLVQRAEDVKPGQGWDILGTRLATVYSNADFKTGDLGVICSFGAGYSIGWVIVRKL
jgi:hypothetical protein